MNHIGFFCFDGRGHLYPGMALARGLAVRGHEITFFHRKTAEATIRSGGFGFMAIDQHEKQTRINQNVLRNREWLMSTESFSGNIDRVFREAHEAIGSARVDSLVVDQNDLAAGTIADALGLPFVTVACSPFLYLSDRIPPSCFGWRHYANIAARVRNKMGDLVVGALLAPALAVVNNQRRKWGLRPFSSTNEAFSKLAAITQLPRVLDFENRTMPAHFFHTGPFLGHRFVKSPAFPWDRLKGKPLVYASLGTVHNSFASVFRAMVEACATLDVQLVLSLGGGTLTPRFLGCSSGDAVVVHYAPQMEILSRASLVITHGGLNTVLESLSNGVPMIVIPITDDQPGVAARIERVGAGIKLSFGMFSASRLREAIGHMLRHSRYERSARYLKKEIETLNGVDRATDIIERVIRDNPRRGSIRGTVS